MFLQKFEPRYTLIRQFYLLNLIKRYMKEQTPKISTFQSNNEHLQSKSEYLLGKIPFQENMKTVRDKIKAQPIRLKQKRYKIGKVQNEESFQDNKKQFGNQNHENGDEDEDEFQFQQIDMNPKQSIFQNFTLPNKQYPQASLQDQHEVQWQEQSFQAQQKPLKKQHQQIIQQNMLKQVYFEQEYKPHRNRVAQNNYTELQQPQLVIKSVKLQSQSQANEKQNQKYEKEQFELPDHTAHRNLTYSNYMRKQIRIHDENSWRQQKDNNSKIDQVPKRQQIPERQQIPCINNIFCDEFFAGRLSVVWLFIIKQIEPNILACLQNIYRNITKRDYEIPLCRNVGQALQFFKSENSFFKVIVDLDNAPELIKRNELQKKILSIYLYNNDSQNGLIRSISIKSCSNKVRGSYINLTPLLRRAQSDIQNGNKFVKQKQGTIQQIKFQSKLPTFIKLSNEDKSQITAYRINLYGAIKLQDHKERHEKTKQFQELVRRVYYKEFDQINNLQEYLKINHVKCSFNDENKHFQVLRFYVQQSFYYKITNNMLRICRNVEQFKPLTIPFNENYNAIKYFYEKSLTDNQNVIPAYQLYRGASIKQKDLQQLKQGDFIELLGFVSTSKNEIYTRQNFIRKRGDYLFIFNIRQMKIKESLKCLDHGFVDLGQYQIAQTQYKAEQQVLLNALNVYKITKIVSEEDSHDKIGRVYLEYGAIYELYQKDADKLTEVQNSVLTNYRYCIKQMNQIQDHGDVLMKAQQYDKCKDFYNQKIKRQERVEFYNKLAQAHYNCGETDQARINAIKSLEKYEKQFQQKQQIDRQTSLKILEIHQKNVQIFMQKQDSPNAKRSIDFEIGLLDQQTDWLMIAQKLQQRGQINFKQGNILQSEKDLNQSEQILLSKKKSFEQRRKQVQKRYFFKSFCSCFFFSNNTELIQEKTKQLARIDNDEQQLLRINNRIHELLLKINESITNVAQFIGDKKTYQQCVQKAKNYLNQIVLKQSQNNFQIARIKVIEAKVQNAIQEVPNVEISYDLMSEAIQLVQQIQPMHQKVGQYSVILGLFKKKSCTKSLIQPDNNENMRNYSQKSQKNMPSLKKIIQNEAIHEQDNKNSQRNLFNQEVHKLNYVQVKQHLEKAILVISYHKTQDHPKVFEVRNHLGELQYEFSNLREGQFQANSVLNTLRGPKHSQGAKSALLLAKIYLSQGQIKSSFENIERSYQILRQALVKQQNNAVYNQIFVLSPTYIQIELYRCKIYNRQMEHDLALSCIKKLRDVGKRKLRDPDGVGYLADIYEEYGNTLVFQGDTVNFQKYYLKAMQLRQKQMGKYNILNAICLCTMAKYLLFTMDVDTAEGYLQQSFGIFSHFSQDHPNLWVQLSTMAYLSEKVSDKKGQLDEITKSVQLIEKRYSKNHINYMKMKIRYAGILSKNDRHEQALKIYEDLEKQMESDLSLTKKGEIVNTIKQNQKVGIKQHIERHIKQTHIHISNSRGKVISNMDESIGNLMQVQKILLSSRNQTNTSPDKLYQYQLPVVGQKQNKIINVSFSKQVNHQSKKNQIIDLENEKNPTKLDDLYKSNQELIIR